MSIFDNPANVRASSAPYVSARNPRATDGRFTSGPVGFEWRGLAKLSDKVQAYSDSLDAKRVAGAQRLANDALAYMKANAKWKDRTGNARALLQATVQDRPGDHQTDVSIGHGVFYGYFLETKTYSGVSYAIIKPTVTAFRDRLADYLK